MAVLEDDDLPAASSYKLPIGGASADILAGINSRVSSLASGTRSCKISKLLLYQGIRSHKFCRFEVGELPMAKALNHHVTELAGLRSFDSLNKASIVWSSTKMEDMKAAAPSIIEAASWMDLWTFHHAILGPRVHR